jgi:hypothetical protein
VRHWQLWAEPNLRINLGPQFEGTRPTDVYRPMLNAFYANLKAVSPQEVVITGGTAPYGDLARREGAARSRPVPSRSSSGGPFFCPEKGKKKKKKRGSARAYRPAYVRSSCADPPHLDEISHHPTNVGRPRRRAINPDDVTTPDLGKITEILRKAVLTKRVLPPGRKPLWATEIYWNSNPPRPGNGASSPSTTAGPLRTFTCSGGRA